MRFFISFPAWSALWWDAGFTLQSKGKEMTPNEAPVSKLRRVAGNSEAIAIGASVNISAKNHQGMSWPANANSTSDCHVPRPPPGWAGYWLWSTQALV